jgi:hypothetical protein
MPIKAEAYAKELAAWDAMLKAIEVHSEELGMLQEEATLLRSFIDRADALVVDHEKALAERLSFSKELQGIVTEGRKAATFLRNGLKRKYGNRSEKLFEFGVQPLRSRPRIRRRPKAATGPEPEPTSPSSPVPPFPETA